MIANYQRIQDVDAHQLLGSNGHLGCMLYMLQLCQSTSMSPHYITCQNVHRCFSLCDFQTAWGRVPRRAMDDVPSLKGLRLKWRKTGVSTSSAVDVAHQDCDNDVVVVCNEPGTGHSADPFRALLEANSGLDLGFDAESCHAGASSLYEPSSDFLERSNDSAVDVGGFSSARETLLRSQISSSKVHG